MTSPFFLQYKNYGISSFLGGSTSSERTERAKALGVKYDIIQCDVIYHLWTVPELLTGSKESFLMDENCLKQEARVQRESNSKISFSAEDKNKMFAWLLYFPWDPLVPLCWAYLVLAGDLRFVRNVLILLLNKLCLTGCFTDDGCW